MKEVADILKAIYTTQNTVNGRKAAVANTFNASHIIGVYRRVVFLTLST